MHAVIAMWRAALYLRGLLRWSRALTEWEQEELDRQSSVMQCVEEES